MNGPPSGLINWNCLLEMNAIAIAFRSLLVRTEDDKNPESCRGKNHRTKILTLYTVFMDSCKDVIHPITEMHISY
jgi:hypothetical protein